MTEPPKGVAEGFRFLSNDTLFYGFASAIMGLSQLILLPILARHLSISEFGVFDTLTVSIIFFAAFLGLGLDSGVARFIRDPSIVRSNLLTSAVITQVAFSLPALVLIGFFIYCYLSFSKYNQEFFTLFVLTLTIVPFAVLVGTIKAYLRYTFNRKAFLLLTLGHAFGMLTVLGAGAWIFSASLHFLIFLKLAVWLGAACFGLFAVRQHLMLPMRLFAERRIMAYSIPMGLIVAIAAFQPMLERIMVQTVIGDEAVGLYAVGARVAMIIALPIGAFSAAFGAFFMAMHERPEAQDLFNFLLKVFLWALSVACLCIVAFSEPIVRVVAGEQFAVIAPLVLPLTLSYVINAIGLFLGMGTVLAYKTYWRLLTFLISIAVTGVLMFFMGGWLGLMGVAFGVLIARFLALFMESALGQVLWPMAWDYWRFGVMILVLMACSGVVFFVGVSGEQSIPIILFGMIFVTSATAWLIMKSSEKSIFSRLLFSFIRASHERHP